MVSNTNSVKAELVTHTLKNLPKGEVLVKVSYSGVNYKDALATVEGSGVVAGYPRILGIDLAGEVVESEVEAFHPGDKVLATGYGLGVSHDGGLSEYQHVPSSWLIKLPTGLSEKESMIYGTAGFTAALAVKRLEDSAYPKDSKIVVTGASGGVGSITIALLNLLGYSHISAISRKTNQEWLLELGAKEVVSPGSFISEKIKPLTKAEYRAVIDTVGGQLLSALLPKLAYQGTAILCGNAGGITIKTTVLPFILRAVQVIGIDSVNVSLEDRLAVWDLLSTNWNVVKTLTYREIKLKDVTETVDELLKGAHVGRTIVKCQ